MKATDFNLARDLTYDTEAGMTMFKDNRMLIFDSGAIGLLRQNLIEKLGIAEARKFFLRFGYQCGHSDFMQIKLNYDFDSEMDLLAAGPVIHTFEGIVHAKPTELKFSRADNQFYFTGIWTNSYEADQHLMYNEVSDEAVCWSVVGYASGWCNAFFGKPLLAIESTCRGKGDEHCGWLIKPVSEFGDEAKPYIDALNDFIGR